MPRHISKTPKFPWLVLLGMIVPLGGALRAEVQNPSDWPQFQGPQGDGSSPERGLLRSWPDVGPRVLWRAKIKPGWGSPVVVGNEVYLGWTEELRGEKETIACLTASEGKMQWKHTYEVGPYWKRNIGWARGGFRSSPCVAGDHVFTLGAVGHLHCLDRHSGEVNWSRNLWEEWNPSGEKGYVFSPLAVDGKLLLWYSDGVSPANENRPRFDNDPHGFFVLCQALDAATGKLAWEFRETHRGESRLGEGQTPAVADFAGEPCLIVNGNAELKALRIRDGKQVWQYAGSGNRMRGTTIPTPLVLPRHIVSIPDADPMQVIELDRASPKTSARTLWEKQLEIYCPIHQFRHHEGYLYGFAGEIKGADERVASESALNLVCVELATGEVKWTQGGFRAGVSLTLADGLLFVRSYQTLRLIEATPEAYRQLGEAKTHDVWKPTLNLLDFSLPVLSRGRLYIRTPDELLCYDVAGEN